MCISSLISTDKIPFTANDITLNTYWQQNIFDRKNTTMDKALQKYQLELNLNFIIPY